jgi:hypothetical protein
LPTGLAGGEYCGVGEKAMGCRLVVPYHAAEQTTTTIMPTKAACLDIRDSSLKATPAKKPIIQNGLS